MARGRPARTIAGKICAVDRASTWPAQASGPTATVAQRARRRRPGLPSARVLVLARRSPGEELASALDELGFQAEWTDSGAGAICEAAAGDLALCVIGVDRQSEGDLDYLACLNQVDPWLPLIVVNDFDSLETQRKVRSHRVFYYLVEPLDTDEVRAVIDAAARERVK
ncbi:MAG: ANTAR domain-containing protein [Candidatus Methylomirabilia bacterium]